MLSYIFFCCHLALASCSLSYPSLALFSPLISPLKPLPTFSIPNYLLLYLYFLCNSLSFHSPFLYHISFPSLPLFTFSKPLYTSSILLSVSPPSLYTPCEWQSLNNCNGKVLDQQQQQQQLLSVSAAAAAATIAVAFG